MRSGNANGKIEERKGIMEFSYMSFLGVLLDFIYFCRRNLRMQSFY